MIEGLIKDMENQRIAARAAVDELEQQLKTVRDTEQQAIGALAVLRHLQVAATPILEDVLDSAGLRLAE